FSSYEHPKGEFGRDLVYDFSIKPHCLKIRSPAFAHMPSLDEVARCHMNADSVTIIGTLDRVFRQVDLRSTSPNAGLIRIQTMPLSDQAYQKIDRDLAKFPSDRRRSVIIASLAIAHEEKGWLPPEVLEDVANYLAVPPSTVQEVATFYNMFDTKPVGKH